MKVRLNKLYAAFVAIVSTAGLGFIGWSLTAQVYKEWSIGVPISGGFSWPIVIGIDVACLACASAVYWSIYANARTTIDASGVYRPSLFGLRRVEWREVTDIRIFNGVGIHLIVGNRKLVLSAYAYEEPNKVFEAVQKFVASYVSPDRA